MASKKWRMSREVDGVIRESNEDHANELDGEMAPQVNCLALCSHHLH